MFGSDGSVWETRAGSLAGPVVADATGADQGYAQLVCMIGDLQLQPPTPAAQESLMRTPHAQGANGTHCSKTGAAGCTPPDCSAPIPDQPSGPSGSAST